VDETVSRNYLAKKLAAEQGIPYAEAFRRVKDDDAPSKPTWEERILAEVKRACWDIVGEKVAYRFGGGYVAGVSFADELRLPSPPQIEQLRIHVMETDYSTLVWRPIEVLPQKTFQDQVIPGVQTGYVTVESRVGFRCVMTTADPIDDPTLDFPDEYVDERHVLVSLEREVLLLWHTTLIDGQEPDLLFGQGEVRPPAAHSAAR
jgi:hypothetical protein